MQSTKGTEKETKLPGGFVYFFSALQVSKGMERTNSITGRRNSCSKNKGMKQL